MKPYIGPVIIIMIVALPLFAHLDHLPINLYDESRLAVNAIEMSRSHNWLVTTYLGKPEMWNTKPPLMIWLQVLTIKLLGPCELAIRLPAALAALGTLLMVYWFCAKKLKRPVLGILSSIIMVTSMGFIGEHQARTGDYDSLLTFFVTGYLVSYFLFIEEDKRSYLLYSLLLLTAAVLTKGVAGLLITPAMFVYTLYRKKLKAVLTTPNFYIGIIFFIGCVATYYLLREHYNPGYLKAVYNNELGGRYNEVNEDHAAPWYFYFLNLMNDRFNFWWYLVPIGLMTGIFLSDKYVKRFTVFTIHIILFYYLILSYSATKLWWYDMPVYPWLAMTAAIGIYFTCSALVKINKLSGIVLIGTIILLIACFPYKRIIEYVLAPRLDYSDNSSIIRYLQETSRHKRSILGDTVPMIEQNTLWYVEAFHLGIIGTPVAQLQIGQRPMVYNDGDRQYLEQHFTFNIIDRFEKVTVYKITGTK